MTALSIVIVTYLHLDLLDACLASVMTARRHLNESSELIIVDNGSPDDVPAVVGAHDQGATVVRLEQNVGFSGAINHGLQAAHGDWLALFNDDTTLEPDALARLLAAARAGPRIGSLAAQMRFAARPGTINSAGLEIDRLGNVADRLVGAPAEPPDAEPVEVFGTSGGAALYRRELIEELGGFDPTFFACLEDADVAWRARMRGWRCVYVPGAVVLHHHSATLVHASPEKYALAGRNRVRLLAKNASAGLLIRYGLVMVAYDLAYVIYAAVRERTLAPLRGRLTGLREWRRYRRAGAASRRPVQLAPARGFRAALRRRRAWSAGSAE